MFKLPQSAISSLLNGNLPACPDFSKVGSSSFTETPAKIALFNSALAAIRTPGFHRNAIQTFKSAGLSGIKEFELVFEKATLTAIRDMLEKGAMLPAGERRTVAQFKMDLERRLDRVNQRLGRSIKVNGKEVSVDEIVGDIVGKALEDPTRAAGGRLYALTASIFNPESINNDSKRVAGGDRDSRPVKKWQGDDRIGRNRGDRDSFSTTSRGGYSPRFGRRAAIAPNDQDGIGDVIPRTIDEAAAWYRDQVKSIGGVWAEGVNQINVIGVRGRRVDGTRHTNATVGQKVYDDTIAYVWRDQSGQMQVYEFQATLDPTQLKGIQAGARLGVPQANAGQQIQYEVGDHKGRPNMGVMVGSAAATRYFDSNHDGRLSPEEGRSSTAGGMNVHDKYSSAGCLVFPMDNPTYRQNVQPIVLRDPDHQFRVTIIDLSIGAKPSSK